MSNLIGCADMANHELNKRFIGMPDGANHEVKEIWIGGTDGANHKVWSTLEGDWVLNLPSAYVGTNTYYDHGDYLYGELNGHTTPEIRDGASRAYIRYVIGGLKVGDIVKIVWSANANQDYSENYILTDGISQHSPSGGAFAQAEYDITMPQNGSISVGINLGTTSTIDRWFKIHSITINGTSVYP